MKSLRFSSAAVYLVAQSFAIDAAAVDPATAARDLELEEIVVTATRRTENLQDIAMSVSALSGEALKNSGVTQISGLEQYVPNLKITTGADSRSTSIRIRGLGSAGTNSGIDPSVGVFIDGVYQGRAGMAISDLVDVERIEVLRGPQGTLYGKNTAAGAITINTYKPSAAGFDSMLEISYDDTERAELRGSVNLPLGDTGHALRTSGFFVDGDHLFTNSYTGKGANDAHKWGARSRLLLDLEKDDANYGELLLTADYTREDTDCCAFAVISYDGLSTLNIPITDTPSAAWQQMLGLNSLGRPVMNYRTFTDTEGYPPPRARPFSEDYWFDGELGNKVDVGGLALEWNRELPGNHLLTLVDAWRHYESVSQYDGDFTAYNAVLGTNELELDQYSSEIRIMSQDADRLSYQFGLYAYYSELASVGTFSMQEPLTRNIGLSFFFPDGSVNRDVNNYDTTSFAAFGQATWELTDELSVTLGIRATQEKKSRDGSQITTPSFFLDLPPVAGKDLYFKDNRSDSDVSPSVNLRYFFTPDVMGYALVSRGFKSGGYNQLREISTSNGEFDQEIATNYELGWKATLLDRRLRLNGTLFRVDYDDFQSQTFDGSSIRVTNAGSMRSQGVELELSFLVTEGLSGGTSLGYDKAEYQDFDNGQCTVERAFYEFYVVGKAQGGSPGTSRLCVRDLAGEKLDNVPELTVSTYLQYETALARGLHAVARIEHNYVDEYYLDQDLDPNLFNDAVDLVNVRLGIASDDGGWDLTLWGRNVLDEKYYVVGIDIPTVGGYAGITAPRAVYGVTLRLYH